jgi:hypothetical protein
VRSTPRLIVFLALAVLLACADPHTSAEAKQPPSGDEGALLNKHWVGAAGKRANSESTVVGAVRAFVAMSSHPGERTAGEGAPRTIGNESDDGGISVAVLLGVSNAVLALMAIVFWLARGGGLLRVPPETIWDSSGAPAATSSVGPSRFARLLDLERATVIPLAPDDSTGEGAFAEHASQHGTPEVPSRAITQESPHERELRAQVFKKARQTQSDTQVRLVELCERLAIATAAGELEWTPQEETSFVCERQSVIFRVRSRDRNGEPPYELALFNSDRMKVARLLSEWSSNKEPAFWNDDLAVLYAIAHRQALDVTRLLDDLLAELPRIRSVGRPWRAPRSANREP